MRYHVLALDYDGTIAHHGRVDENTLRALETFKNSGRKLVLVTGRELDDLLTIFPEAALFDRVVAENGGVLYRPANKERKPLGPPPPPELVTALKEAEVSPLSTGSVLIASWDPHEKAIVEAIHSLGLEYQIIFNKGAIMVLPSGINKATGLQHALDELGISIHNTAGVGDAENDHAFLSECEFSAAVANALESLKKRVDLVLKGDHGAGIVEFIDAIVQTDLKDIHARRHLLRLGRMENDEPLLLDPYGNSILLCGTSGGGKSTFATSFLERLADSEYQFCIIDPEGDYETLEMATTLGDNHHGPSADEVIDLLKKPKNANVVVNLLSVTMSDRPSFFESLFSRLHELRAKVGHPQWIIVDEAHHLLPPARSTEPPAPRSYRNIFFITVHPDKVSPEVLASINLFITVGQSPASGFRAFAEALHLPVPDVDPGPLETGEAVAWFRDERRGLVKFKTDPPHTQRRRHIRKYALGELGPDKSFYFHGPDGKLNLRAQNLQTFMSLADGLDDDTWLYHLRRGDYSNWFRDSIKDPSLADEAFMVEKEIKTAGASRKLIKASIEERYTHSA